MASHGSRKARTRDRVARGASRSEHVLFLRLTAGEHAIYQQLAAGARLTVSEWARRVLHAQTVPRVEVDHSPVRNDPVGDFFRKREKTTLGGAVITEMAHTRNVELAGPGGATRRLDVTRLDEHRVPIVPGQPAYLPPGDPDLEF